jgi:hypothetical protein
MTRHHPRRTVHHAASSSSSRPRNLLGHFRYTIWARAHGNQAAVWLLGKFELEVVCHSPSSLKVMEITGLRQPVTDRSDLADLLRPWRKRAVCTRSLDSYEPGGA